MIKQESVTEDEVQVLKAKLKEVFPDTFTAVMIFDESTKFDGPEVLEELTFVENTNVTEEYLRNSENYTKVQ